MSTSTEIELIRQRVEAVYRGPNAGDPWFDVRIVTNLNDIPTEYLPTEYRNARFATIYFNQTPTSGRPGGLASEIDPGNVNLGGNAVVQVNGLLGGIITSLESEAEIEGDLDAFKGDHQLVSDLEVGATKPAGTSDNFVRLSSKVAAHELAHLMGLRHQDSFGPIGSGVHDPPGIGGYKPVYTGPAGGVETFDHLIGSPATIGTTRFDDLNDLFFGEREAIKLAFANSNPAQTTITSTGGNHSQSMATALKPVTLAVPNTLSRGLNEPKDFFVQIASVLGEIRVDSTMQKSNSDWYSFEGRAGDLINIDVLSNSVARFGTGAGGALTPDDYVDTIVRVWYDVGGVRTLVPYYDGTAVNDDTFEPTDSSIIDLVLPTSGTYYIEVDTFKRESTDADYAAAVALQLQLQQRQTDTDPSNDLSPAEMDVLQRLTDTLEDTDTGRYQLIMSKFRKASSSDLIDDLKGFGGVDIIVGGPGENYTLDFSLGSAATSVNEGSAFSRLVTVSDRGGSDWTGRTVNYGDNTGDLDLVVSESGEFMLNHVWADNGSFTVTVSIVDDIGQTLTRQLDITVINVAPAVAINGAPATSPEATAITLTSTASDVAGANDPLTYVWSVTKNGANYATGNASGFSFTPDDNGAYVVTLTVDDGDGGNGTSTKSITVNNVAPTPTISSISSTRLEGTSISFSGTATDPAGSRDTLSYVWNFGDGSATASGADVTHIYADNGTFTVTLTVSDEDGGSASTTQTITVANVAPTAVFSNGGDITPSQTATVSFSNSTDPSPEDMAAAFQYFYDFDNDDTFDLSSSSSSVNVPSSYTAGAGTKTVRGRIADKDGGNTDYSTHFAVIQVLSTAAATVNVDRTLYGIESVRITATVAPATAGGFTPTGTVSFYDGSTLLGMATLNSGSATLDLGTTTLPVGTRSVSIVYSGNADYLSSEDDVSVTVLAPSLIQGFVYLDQDNDGQVDVGENGISGVTVTLTGTDDRGNTVNLSVPTDSNGVYFFNNLRPANAAGYSLTQNQPAGYADGMETLGTIGGIAAGTISGNDSFSGIVLSDGQLAENYNFAELSTSGGGDGAIQQGETAGIGFWQNKNGQNLIIALNGSASSTQLGNWLAATFPKMYGSLAGQTNTQVAAYYKKAFALNGTTSPGGPPKLDAQVMATALSVYVTKSSLAGNTASAYGFLVTTHGVGTGSVNVTNRGAAFGIADNSTITIMDLLLAVNSRAHDGLLFDVNSNGSLSSAEISLRVLANSLFDEINGLGGF
ncbi:MAG: PKD domain-containing protein [Planctomycetaceae bacterium]